MKKLIGKKIVNVDSKKEGELEINLSNGDKLIFGEMGEIGADSGWYTVPVLWRQNKKTGEKEVIWKK